VLFRECRVTHEPREEPLDGVGCFPVSSSVQVVGEFLEVLLSPIGDFQALCNLLLVFPADIPQEMIFMPEITDLASHYVA
jgi:hypothetical protein